jgi:endonuclease G
MGALRTLAAVLIASGLLVSIGAEAAPTACPQHFAGGESPDLTNPRLSANTYGLCYTGYAVLFSGLTRTLLWSAEHLTAQRVRNSRGDTRVNSFHADPGLPPGVGAEMSDYARSGYDRGHMAPSGDMPDPRSQDESFSLANMIPQVPDLNRRLWSAVESAVRDLAVENGAVYVVTGPIFTGANVQSLRGRVLIPTHVFKAVYDPRRRAGAAYLAANAPGQDARVITLAELRRGLIWSTRL